MARFMAFHQAIKGAEWLVKDIGMGGARKDIGKSLGELSAVGFDRLHKADTEIAAQKFARNFYDTTADAYIKAMSQTASAFDVGKLGTSTLNRLNAAAVHTARLSKMTPEAAAEMQSKLLNSFLSAQSKGVYETIQSGGTANVKGFGNVDLAGMSEKMMAMFSKSIEISNIWGKGMMEFHQYAAPIMAAKGWVLAQEAQMNKLGARMFQERMKGIGPAPKDKMSDEWQDWNEQVTAASKDVKRLMRKTWEETHGGQNIEDSIGQSTRFQGKGASFTEVFIPGFNEALQSATGVVVDFGQALKSGIDRMLPKAGEIPPDIPLLPIQPGGSGKLSSAEGEGAPQAPVIHVHMNVAGHEFRDIVTQVLSDMNMTNRNRFGNTFS